MHEKLNAFEIKYCISKIVLKLTIFLFPNPFKHVRLKKVTLSVRVPDKI